MPRRSGTVPAGRTHFSPQGPLDVLSPWSESRLRHHNWSAHWHRLSQRGLIRQLRFYLNSITILFDSNQLRKAIEDVNSGNPPGFQQNPNEPISTQNNESCSCSQTDIETGKNLIFLP